MSAYDTPQMKCPYCGSLMDADWCDVGVGMVQCGPYHCFKCGASEQGPETIKDGFEKTVTKEELETGFYRGKVSPLANVDKVTGEPISYKEADAQYREDYFKKHGNPYSAPVRRFGL